SGTRSGSRSARIHPSPSGPGAPGATSRTPIARARALTQRTTPASGWQLFMDPPEASRHREGAPVPTLRTVGKPSLIGFPGGMAGSRRAGCDRAHGAAALLLADAGQAYPRGSLRGGDYTNRPTPLPPAAS